MFDATSRYASVEQATLSLPDPNGGTRVVVYVRRRFLPSTSNLTTLVEHTVVDGDRLDNLSARYLGDPLRFWQICDANPIFRPDELTETPGRSIEIAMPGPGSAPRRPGG
jgi:hypothetical protein